MCPKPFGEIIFLIYNHKVQICSMFNKISKLATYDGFVSYQNGNSPNFGSKLQTFEINPQVTDLNQSLGVLSDPGSLHDGVVT